jgi:hypothetical protein
MNQGLAIASAIASCLAAIAAIAGAVIVWKQLSKLNQQIEFQHFAEYTKRYQEIIQRFPEDVNEPEFQIEGRPEYYQTMRAMRSYFDLCFEEWYLSQHHRLNSEIWEAWRGGMATALSKPAFQQAWAIIAKHSRRQGTFA